MITFKEIASILLALIILAFSRAFLKLDKFLISLLFFAIILIIYIVSKKLMAYYLECEEETKIWTFQRYGMYERSYMKTPFPIGLVLPFVLTILSLGYIPWYAVLESDVQGTPARAARKHDFYSFTELTEWHIALISAAGILGCFILSIVAYLINQADLGRLALFYACFNLIPLGKLDGLRILLGSRLLYILLWIIAIIGLVYAFLMF